MDTTTAEATAAIEAPTETVTKNTKPEMNKYTYEEALKSSPRFEQISSPLSDIIRGAASFTVQGHLKSSGL